MKCVYARREHPNPNDSGFFFFFFFCQTWQVWSSTQNKSRQRQLLFAVPTQRSAMSTTPSGGIHVLVCGSRGWTDYPSMLYYLKRLHENTPGGIASIRHGACRGADLAASKVAAALKIPCSAFPAHWNRYGPAAGPKRNQEMLEAQPMPQLVLAFVDTPDGLAGKGTADMLRKAKSAGIQTVEIKHAK